MGDIKVVRKERKENYGYDWTVTFINSDWYDTSLFKVPQIKISNIDALRMSEYTLSVNAFSSSFYPTSTFNGTTASIKIGRAHV